MEEEAFFDRWRERGDRADMVRLLRFHGVATYHWDDIERLNVGELLEHSEVVGEYEIVFVQGEGGTMRSCRLFVMVVET